jgi:hypothetical protein
VTDNRFEKLVAAARREQAPTLDVSQAVMDRLEDLRTERLERRVWTVAGLVSVLVATFMCFLVYPEWESLQDPMLALVEPIRVSLQ